MASMVDLTLSFFRRKRQLASTAKLALCKVTIIEGKEPPEWIQLIPAGEVVKARDGREFKNPKPQAIVEAFSAQGVDLPLDWEHASELKAPKGEKAPAAAWITSLEVREGSVWGRVEWTKEGARCLLAREYRYVSPGFYHDKKGVIVGLSSAGLTNKPALTLAELAREGDSGMKELYSLLGLEDDASDEDVTKAIMAMKEQLAAYQEKDKPEGDEGDEYDEENMAVDDDPDLAAEQTTVETPPGDEDDRTDKKELARVKTKLKAANGKLALARAWVRKHKGKSGDDDVSLADFVPREDYDLALTRVKKLEDKNTATETKVLAREIDTEIQAALAVGKITPATADFYRKQCQKEGGLALFREFVEVAPVILSDEEIVTGETPQGSSVVLTSEERKFVAVMGLTEEEYRDGAEY